MGKHILITGGTGLIGTSLIKELQSRGHTIAVLSRSKSGIYPSYQWDYKKKYIEDGAFSNVDTIVHLAGAGVADKRWSADRKEEILKSRTETTALLFESLKNTENNVKTFIGASAIGFYGSDTGNVMLDETAPFGNDFLAQVTRAWETSAVKMNALGVRTTLLRIGIVLSNQGGALQELLKPPVAATLGNGKQFMSWIHIKDLVDMFIHNIENEKIEGVFNAVGTSPVTNKDFTRIASKVYKKPFLPLPVPGFVLKLLMGEMASIVLGGNKVSAEKISKSGFNHSFNDLEGALKDLK